MHNDQYAQAAHLTAIAQATSPAPMFGDLAAPVAWDAGSMAAAERSPRTRKPNRRPAVRVLAMLGLAGYLAGRKAGAR